MTTKYFSSTLDHTTDAGFRTWGNNIHTNLVAAGLTNTSDTGQIDFTTVTKPATNTSAGYKIYKFTDTAASTNPVYIKLEFGSGGSSVNKPAMWISTATSTDGAGTLTGDLMCDRSTISYTNLATNSTSVYDNYICLVDGALVCAFAGINTYNPGFWSLIYIARSVKTDGTIDADHISVYMRSQGTATQVSAAPYCYPYVFSYTDGAYVSYASGAFTFCPFQSSLYDGGTKLQVIKHFGINPELIPVPWMLTIVNGEVPRGTSFSATPVGSTAHTYMSLGNLGRYVYNWMSQVSSSPDGYAGFALIWE